MPTATLRSSILALAAAGCLLAGCSKLRQVQAATGPQPEEAVFLGTPANIDRLYPSMRGPFQLEYLAIDLTQTKKVWLVGFKTTMVGEDGNSARPQEYNCHSDMQMPRRTVQPDVSRPDILFTLSQGQDHIRFPEGYGIPMAMNEPLSVATQILNVNGIPPQPYRVRHRVAIEYFADEKLEKPMKPLLPVQALGLKALGNNKSCFFNLKETDPAKQGDGCLRGTAVSQRNVVTDKNGNKFTSHWVVPPGREVNHTLVTNYLNLKYDTTIHYISAHLHPFAEWCELRDLTAKKVVWRCDVKLMDSKLGLSEVGYYSSPEGLPIYKDHQYELVSSYNNTSGQPQDAMVVLYMYLHDKETQAGKAATKT